MTHRKLVHVQAAYDANAAASASPSGGTGNKRLAAASAAEKPKKVKL